MNKWHNPLAHKPEFANVDHPIHSLILNEIKKVEVFYNASAKIAVLDGMSPGSRIYPHFDQSKLYDVAHRVHLPLVTDERVKFSIDNVEYHFKAGQFFEFNNKLVHSVDNNSELFRIHLVMDLIPNVSGQLI
jgi:aspartyl/asparaginyl beta-hydroxylase (cupin superfamily)